MDIQDAVSQLVNLVEDYGGDRSRLALKTIRAVLSESQKPSTNTESMPCLVGVHKNLCSLGFGGRCVTPACQLSRTAHVS